MEKTYVLYFHRNPITNGVFYVGVGDSKRPYSKLGRNDFWRKYVLKYGNPIVEIIETDLSKEDSNFWEDQYVRMFGRRGIDSGGCLVNRAPGGMGRNGLIWTDEMKKRMSEMKSGVKLSPERIEQIRKSSLGRIKSEETREKIRQSKLGIPRSEICKQKLRAANLGKSPSEETREKLSKAFSGENNHRAVKIIDTKTGIIYGQVKEAASVFNIHRATLSRYLNGRLENKTSLKYLDN